MEADVKNWPADPMEQAAELAAINAKATADAKPASDVKPATDAKNDQQKTKKSDAK
jgi:hypothetical protein